MNKEIFDVLIIGAGISGTMIARRLSSYNVNVCVLEKHNDVGNETTNANSAIIHSGYDPLPNSKKAFFNIKGNKMFDQICEDLEVPFVRIGSLTLAFDENQLDVLRDLENRSALNNVEVKFLSGEEVLKMEPNINKDVLAGLFAPSAGIIDPFNLCVHAMENAVDNGVKLFLSEEVISIKKENELFVVKTNNNEYLSRIVVNAAGNYADKIASMFEDIDWKIVSRKGEYFVLDHFKNKIVNHVIFPTPSEKGKGILITPTTSGNFLVGPSSEPINSHDDYSTDKFTLDNIKASISNMISCVPYNEVIRVFSGLRPVCTRHDFIIESSKKDQKFINVAGIESPGLASSPAIAEYVVENLIAQQIKLTKNTNYNPKVRTYSDNFLYEGEMVCSCEHISLSRINDALTRSVPPRSIKGMKRRTRAGYGRCQGGFCQPTVLLTMAKFYGVSPLDIPLDDINSHILVSKIKETK